MARAILCHTGPSALVCLVQSQRQDKIISREIFSFDVVPSYLSKLGGRSSSHPTQTHLFFTSFSHPSNQTKNRINASLLIPRTKQNTQIVRSLQPNTTSNHFIPQLGFILSLASLSRNQTHDNVLRENDSRPWLKNTTSCVSSSSVLAICQLYILLLDIFLHKVGVMDWSSFIERFSYFFLPQIPLKINNGPIKLFSSIFLKSSSPFSSACVDQTLYIYIPSHW